MLPRIIIHSAVSIDGRLDGFAADLGAYYGLIARWHEDATLVGADTVLGTTQNEPVDEAPGGTLEHPPGNDARPLLVVPDSRGRVRTWQAMRRAGYWRDCIALVSQRTPAAYLEYLRWQRVEALVYGEDHVDIRAALEELGDRVGVRTIRVDSGGTLIGVLLRAGLVDELSLLVHPVLVGGAFRTSMFASDEGAGNQLINASLESAEQLDQGIVWLRYSLRDAAEPVIQTSTRVGARSTNQGEVES